MDAQDRRLDGNTAAGLLEEIFPFDMTMARMLCAGCGSMEPGGVALLYADGPGLVLRCAQCEGVLLRVAHGPDRYWLDMRGLVCLELAQVS